MLDHVGLVDESALGTANLDGLTDNERGHVLGDVALRVGLDKEIKVAGLVVAGDGGIRADDLLGCAIRLGQRCANGDVLADGKAEDRVAGGQLEAVTVVGERRGQLSAHNGQLGPSSGQTYMATLWEMTVFSWSSNSWNVSGFNTAFGSKEESNV